MEVRYQYGGKDILITAWGMSLQYWGEAHLGDKDGRLIAKLTSPCRSYSTAREALQTEVKEQLDRRVYKTPHTILIGVARLRYGGIWIGKISDGITQSAVKYVEADTEEGIYQEIHCAATALGGVLVEIGFDPIPL